MSGPVTAHDVCQGVERVLTAHLRDHVIASGWGDDLDVVEDWKHVPVLSALASAATPVGAITSPGLVTPPTRRGAGGEWDATWRVAVGIYDRDADHTEVASRVRRWAAVVRACVLAHPTLKTDDGPAVARAVRWAGEEYDEVSDRGMSQTIGACAVAFDIDVADAVGRLDPTPALPVVTSTRTRVAASSTTPDASAPAITTTVTTT